MRTWSLGQFQGRDSAVLQEGQRLLSWLSSEAEPDLPLETWIWGQVARRFPGGPAVMVHWGGPFPALVSEAAAAHLHEGQRLCFQVVQQARGSKGPRFSTHLRLIGRFMIHHVHPKSRHHVFPRTCSPEQQQRLHQIAQAWPDAAHWQWRSLACEADEICLNHEAERLRLLAHPKPGKVGQISHRGPSLPERVVREAQPSDRVLVADERLHDTLLAWAAIQHPDRTASIQRMLPKEAETHQDQLDRWYQMYQNPKVSLPSGGFLVVNPTEGMTVVDVNTGNHTGRDAVRQTNEEALEAVVQLLAVCTLQGTIAIDFVDHREHRVRLRRQMKAALEDSDQPVRIHAVEDSSVVLLTRKVVTRAVDRLPCPCSQARSGPTLDQENTLL